MLRKTILAAAAAAISAMPARAGDFAATLFGSPLPPGPGTYIPRGSTLNAPLIMPSGMKHGRSLFEVTPAGTDRKTITTSDPERFLNGSPFDQPTAPERVGWISMEFLYWATQGPSVAPLVTTGPAALGPGAAGFIGQPSTTTLLGGQRMLNGLRPGFRLTLGGFIDDAHDWALSHQIITLGSRSERLVGGSDGSNLVNVPQIVPLGGVPVQIPTYVGFPGATRGTVSASVQSSFFSGDTHLRRVFQNGSGLRLDLLAGYRFLQLGDSVSDSYDVVSATVPGPMSSRLMGENSVRTRNYFHGGEVGFNLTSRTRQFTFELQSTIALGVTDNKTDQSATRSYFPGVGLPSSFIPPGGSNPTIAAESQKDYFSVVPQIGFKLGWQPAQHFRVTFGYDFLYWSRVRRAESLVAPGPILNDTTTDFWAQGLSLGAELRY